MDPKKFWNKKHLDYLSKDWINKPTIFAHFARNYFPEKGKLLDLGAGQGQDSRYFAKLGYQVIATDFSETALEILKRKSEKEGLNIVVQNLDLEKPFPYKDKIFNIIYSHLSLQYFDNKTTESLFNRIHRALKEGGIFAALFNTIDDPEVAISKMIEEGLYDTPSGIVKRLFSLKYLQSLVKGKFETIVADNKGETYKDEIKVLIRYIGKKI